MESWRFSSLPGEEREQVAPFQIPRFHRTLSGWVEIVCEAGLTIEQMAEPRASIELAQAEPVLADTLAAPLFLHIRARKPAAAGSQAGPRS